MMLLLTNRLADKVQEQTPPQCKKQDGMGVILRLGIVVQDEGRRRSTRDVGLTQPLGSTFHLTASPAKTVQIREFPDLSRSQTDDFQPLQQFLTLPTDQNMIYLSDSELNIN